MSEFKGPKKCVKDIEYLRYRIIVHVYRYNTKLVFVKRLS